MAALVSNRVVSSTHTCPGAAALCTRAAVLTGSPATMPLTTTRNRSPKTRLHEIAQDQDVLGPLQTLSAKLKLDFNGINRDNTPSQPQTTEPVTAFRKK